MLTLIFRMWSGYVLSCWYDLATCHNADSPWTDAITWAFLGTRPKYWNWRQLNALQRLGKWDCRPSRAWRIRSFLRHVSHGDQLLRHGCQSSFHPWQDKCTWKLLIDVFRSAPYKKNYDTTYWKFSLFRTGSAEPASPLWTNNSSFLLLITETTPTAKITVQDLKRTRSFIDLCAEAVKGMVFKATANFRCHLSTVSRIARRNRHISDRHPSNPRILKDL